MTEIVLERVSCERSLGPGLGKVRALSDIDLRIGSGEVLTLLGPSGSGKTTLLRVIAGLDRCSAGSIRFGADRVERLGPERRRTAFVFQDPALYPDWTVGRHLESGSDRFSRWLPGWWSGRHAGSSLAGAMSAAGGERSVPASGDIAAWLGLAGSINRKPHQLSGGERHRVALGRAIVREPAAFLFDEPFSALDPATRWELREAVAEVLARSGKTAIFVTHDEREASAHGGRIGVLIAGRLRQVGDWDELISAPADLAVARAVGDPPRTLLEVRASRGDVRRARETGAWESLAWQVAGRGERSDERERERDDERLRIGIPAEAWRIESRGEAGRSENGAEFAVDATLVRSIRWGDRWIAGVAIEGIEGRGASATQGGSDRAAMPGGRRNDEAARGWVVLKERPPWSLGQPIRMVCRRAAAALFDGDADGRLLKAGRA